MKKSFNPIWKVVQKYYSWTFHKFICFADEAKIWTNYVVGLYLIL